MSKYTTELRFICESLANQSESVGYNDVEDIIARAEPIIFDFTYPIHEEAYRTELNRKILLKYYTREICEETYGLWKLRLKSKMLEIMPYYAQLYKSATLDFNPLEDTHIETTEDNTTDYEGVVSTNATSNSTGNNETDTTTENGNDTTVNSTAVRGTGRTPQGSLENVRELNYLSSADVNDVTETRNNTTTGEAHSSGNSSNNTESEQNSESTSQTKDDKKKIVKGKSGASSYSTLLREYRDTLLNIDKLILEELNPLFFGLW